MGRLANIIARARQTLADVDGDRFTDARLVVLAQDAQEDIVESANLLRKKIALAINISQASYTLPEDTLLVQRIMFNGQKVVPKSHDDMDRISPTWENTTGSTVEHVVYDKIALRELIVYPIPSENVNSNTITITNEGVVATPVPAEIALCYNALTGFGVTVDLAELTATVVAPSATGVMTGLTDFTFDSPYGVTTSLTSDDVLLTEAFSSFGVVSDYAETEGLVIYYTSKPTDLVDVNSDLEIEPTWDRAIRYYIVGMALRDDKDTQNVAVAKEELRLYDRQLGRAENNSSKNKLATGKREVAYQGGF
jgi:hypothetical protein